MKKILFSVFCLFLFAGAFAQSLSLQDTNGVAISAGSTYQVLGDPLETEIKAKIHIKNNSAEAKDIKVKKVHINVLPNTVNYFCFGLCYGPDTYVSPFPQTIQPGAVSDQFYGDYNPQTVPGKSTIMYVFFDMNNTNDSVAVYVEFNASPASVADQLESRVILSDAYPNPAISIVCVDYEMPADITRASILVTNMLGCKVKEVSLEKIAGKASIDISDLLDGIYFYSLVADGQLVRTRKFVVRH